jgi:hypothetical protein
VIEPVLILGIPLEFILFGLTLLGIALFHRHTLPIALAGLVAITAYKLAFTGFRFGPGLAGLGQLIAHEWVILSNLFLLLMGFALLSRHFEKSRVPDKMPTLLPDDWKGGFVLLLIVFVLSSFLDNIAAALIGGTMARHVFKKVHIGYLAAIVAASNAGGSGSAVTGHAMVGPPRGKRAPNGSSTVTQRPAASPIPCRAGSRCATAAFCCHGGHPRCPVHKSGRSSIYDWRLFSTARLPVRHPG